MKQVLILSGKGGTGKTTIATALIKLGKIKAFADCDVDAPNLHLLVEKEEEFLKEDYYGMDKAVIDEEKCDLCGKCIKNCKFNAIKKHIKYEIDKYFCEGCGVCEKICPQNAIELEKSKSGELRLLSNEDQVFSTAKLKMGSGNSGLLVTKVKNNLKENIKGKNIDISIIDGSPGIGCPVIASLNGADILFLVVEPSLSGFTDMKRIVETSKRYNIPTLVCINKYDINITKTKEIEKYCIDENLELAGKIPYDKKVVQLLNEKKSLIDKDENLYIEIEKMYKKILERI